MKEGFRATVLELYRVEKISLDSKISKNFTIVAEHILEDHGMTEKVWMSKMKSLCDSHLIGETTIKLMHWLYREKLRSGTANLKP